MSSPNIPADHKVVYIVTYRPLSEAHASERVLISSRNWWQFWKPSWVYVSAILVKEK